MATTSMAEAIRKYDEANPGKSARLVVMALKKEYPSISQNSVFNCRHEVKKTFGNRGTQDRERLSKMWKGIGKAKKIDAYDAANPGAPVDVVVEALTELNVTVDDVLRRRRKREAKAEASKRTTLEFNGSIEPAMLGKLADLATQLGSARKLRDYAEFLMKLRGE